MKTTLATLAAAGLALTANAAHANSVNVTYDDLNLATEAGQKVLEQRIESAARSVCGLDRQRTGTRIPDTAARSCYKKAKASASAQVAARIKSDGLGG
ncbi:MAG: UrcA family protein [Erythrobacter sp.]|uniref:UrcA family protein n=1 Tax=Erythrobacter sp. TaxID=1042 RepID=UPI001B2CB1BE|nr:UrcA family protein [Erythrobacter sp.]MBO6767242.1 UrcA family protein [Erythrobacter sp.]